MQKKPLKTISLQISSIQINFYFINYLKKNHIFISQYTYSNIYMKPHIPASHISIVELQEKLFK